MASRGPATKYLHSAAGRRDAAVQALRDQQVALEKRCARQRQRENRLNLELTKFRNASVEVLAANGMSADELQSAIDRLETALRFHLAEPHKLAQKVKRARIALEGGDAES